MTKKQAKDFFGQVAEFSEKALKKLGIINKLPSPNKYRSFRNGQPSGATFHYNASVKSRQLKTISYFLTKGKPSVNMYILDGKLPELADLENQYPLVAKFPSTIIQLVPPNNPSWHGGWVNKTNYGIELRNTGLLHRKFGKMYWWPNKWKTPYTGEYEEFNGKYWEPYTYGQIASSIMLLRHLNSYYKKPLEKCWIIPHSASSATKYDTGPMFPIYNVREAGFNNDPINSIAWLNKYKKGGDANLEEPKDDDDDNSFLKKVKRQFARFGDDEKTGKQIEETISNLRTNQFFHNELSDKFGEKDNEVIKVKKMLAKLGYYPGKFDSEKDDDYITSVIIFQKSVNETSDGIAGKKTKAALKKRIKQMGFE